MNFVDVFGLEGNSKTRKRNWAGDPIAIGNEGYFWDWDFVPHKKLEPQEYEDEIEERMRLFELPQDIIEETKKGEYFLNDRGVITKIKGEEKYEILRLEREYNIKVYYVFKGDHHISMESGYRYFFIDNDKENWWKDKIDIKIHDPLCFKYRSVKGHRHWYMENRGIDSFDLKYVFDRGKES